MTDQNELLCERCAYRLAGLSRSDNCPECGRPVAQSLHARRTPSPWHDIESSGTLFITACRVLRTPRRFFSGVLVVPATGFRWFSIIYASVILATALGFGAACQVAVTEMYAGDDARITWYLALIIVPTFFWVPGSLACAACFVTFTWVQRTGIARLARWRGHRVSPPAASAIVDFSCAAWLGGAALALVLSIIVGSAEVVLCLVSGRPSGYRSEDGVATLVGFACAAASMVWFEVLSLIGLRANRFANSPGGERDLATSPAPSSDAPESAPPSLPPPTPTIPP